MRRPNREIQIFNLSMLDVICGALGAFVILVILLLPYYRKEVIDLSQEVQALEGQVEALEIQIASQDAEIQSLRERVAELEAELARCEAARSESEAAAAECRADLDHVAQLDLVFLLDTTGSMGEQIADMQENIRNLVTILSKITPDLQVGMVAYKDTDEADYVTRDLGLRSMTGAGVNELRRFVDSLEHSGGGRSREESVAAALAVGAGMSWRSDVRGVMVLIADAGPRDLARARQIAARFHGDSPDRIVSSMYTGADEDDHSAMLRQISDSGGGRYVKSPAQVTSGVLLSIFN